MELQDHLSSGRLQLTCACRGELPPYGCWCGDREGAGAGWRQHTGSRGGMGWEGYGVFGRRGKLKTAGTQALGREAEEEAAGPSGKGPSLAKSWTTRSTPVFWEDSPRRSAEARSDRQEDGDQLGGGWNDPGKSRCALSQGMRQARAQDVVSRLWA